ncbi:MAG TPA: homocysteine S-methyltransferase family protein [Gemmataceae bacterium]|jgi:5-methyltetrahydrofolate--homocysteine methyltransferase|nr:homocysteine S-methyltransferase family protein [Gemmataceae bacterium]
MDGAMGTELLRAGAGEAGSHDLCNLTHPKRVRAVHQEYVDAGATVLLTNTFQANPAALARHDAEDQLEAVCRAGVEIARAVAGPDRYAVADIGPLFDPRERGWTIGDLTAVEQICSSMEGADAVLLETFSDPWAFVAAEFCGAALQHRQVPLLLSVTYRLTRSGKVRTAGGHRPEMFARQAGRRGIAALGVNCGRDVGMNEVIEVVRRYRQVTDLPLFARPNAGSPARVDGRWVYPHTSDRMAERLPELLEIGVAMVGGCCGTTPAHIAAFRPVIDRWNRLRTAR